MLIKRTGLIIIIIIFLLLSRHKQQVEAKRHTWWEVQSIDTVKYSRDISREKLDSSNFDQVVDSQVKAIADSGTTHIAIGTPYDQEFVPLLKLWVKFARKHGLLVWFRGNFSGWEQWFGYPKITREDHIRKTKEFILAHEEIFADGDIFTACTECENGGNGDPRKTGDVKGFREFAINEYLVTKEAFNKIGKKVRTNYNSMNGDVARLIMDKDTTKEMDGLVVLDHYVAGAERLVADIRQIAQNSGGKVVLGEFGAPIPDIHGIMNQEEQADWLEETLEALSQLEDLVGVNYWVSFGGSSKLWDEDGKPRSAVNIISKYFKPGIVDGVVKNEIRQPISSAQIIYKSKKTQTDKEGKFQLPIVGKSTEISVQKEGYKDHIIKLNDSQNYLTVTIVKVKEGLYFKIVKLLNRLLLAQKSSN